MNITFTIYKIHRVVGIWNSLIKTSGRLAALLLAPGEAVVARNVLGPS